MRVSVLIVENPDEVVAELSSRWLTPEGRIKLLPAAEFQSVPREQLMLWCNRTARYGIPTLELVRWLKGQIGNRSAIEVGAGNGDLGYHLGIPSTDSFIQCSPELRLYYAALGQVPTTPPEDVFRFDAVAAVKKWMPEVVVASWLTRRFVDGKDVPGAAQASVYGPCEEELVRLSRTYIHLGNEGSHGSKTALKLKHREFSFPWLVSRAQEPEKNVVYLWGDLVTHNQEDMTDGI